MQNNESRKEPNGLHKFIREKGYYILLTVCVLAIGVSGYFFVSGAIRQNQAAQETLSVPVKAQDPEDVKKPASSATGKTQTEVAREIGISQAQVSRLEKNALDHIRSEM